MQQPVFILGLTKSGTSLLRNLLDSHPSLFAIPSESHFFQNTRHWVSYYFRRTKPAHLSFDQMKEELFKWVELLNTTTEQVTDAFTEGRWNLDLVRETLFETKIESLKGLSDVYVKAMYRGLFNDEMPESLNFVEKSVENAEFALEWQKLYPNARFVHIIRNPYSNIVALRKYAGYSKRWQRKFPYLKTSLYSMQNSYYFLYKNQTILENYKVIRYEDLIAEPDSTMRGICDFLDIPFDKCLLQPTILGSPWEGNSTSGNKFSGISKENLERWQSEISSLEIRVINQFMDFVLEDFGYQKLPERKKYLPEKHERISTFIQNRLLLRYAPKF